MDYFEWRKERLRGIRSDGLIELRGRMVTQREMSKTESKDICTSEVMNPDPTDAGQANATKRFTSAPSREVESAL